MAILVETWDLRATGEQVKAYGAKAHDWISTILKQPGVTEYCAYRSPYLDMRGTMSYIKFDTLASAQKWLQSETRAAMGWEMDALGCRNFTSQLFDASLLVPEPLKPSR